MEKRKELKSDIWGGLQSALFWPPEGGRRTPHQHYAVLCSPNFHPVKCSIIFAAAKTMGKYDPKKYKTFSEPESNYLQSFSGLFFFGISQKKQIMQDYAGFCGIFFGPLFRICIWDLGFGFRVIWFGMGYDVGYWELGRKGRSLGLILAELLGTANPLPESLSYH